MKADKVKVKDVPNAVRDTHSKGIIFTDNTQYERVKKQRLVQRETAKKSATQNKKIKSMENELALLKKQMAILLEGKE